jgi:hypothetical protein
MLAALVMKLIFLNLLLFTFSICHSQIDLKNISLKQDTNVLYYQTDNWLKISGTSEKINVISKAGNLINADNQNQFLIIPSSLKNDTLIVFSGKKIILKKIFSIDTLSEIVFHIGAIKKDTATVAEILANRGLMTNLKRGYYRFPMRILSFSLTLIKPGADTILKDGITEGNILSKIQQDLIRQLPSNSKLVFQDIAVVTPNSRIRAFPGFTITTK